MTPERVLHKLFTSNGLTLAGAESCTGGLISNLITNVPGSSSYFKGSVVAYSNSAKASLLKVPASLIMDRGAVSLPTARAMADGARKAFASDIGFSVTGIAGPDGGTRLKPVGLAFIGVSCRKATMVKRVKFTGSRYVIKRKVADAALAFILDTVKTECGNPLT